MRNNDMYNMGYEQGKEDTRKWNQYIIKKAQTTIFDLRKNNDKIKYALYSIKEDVENLICETETVDSPTYHMNEAYKNVLKIINENMREKL